MAHVADADWDGRCLFECKVCNYDFGGEYFEGRSVTGRSLWSTVSVLQSGSLGSRCDETAVRPFDG